MANNSKNKNKDKVCNIKDKESSPDTRKYKEEQFGRQLGKIGCATFIILVAFYFKIPDKVKNIYFLIATTLVIYQPVLRIIKLALKGAKGSGKSVNWIEIGVVASTLGAILFKQYAAAAIFMTLYEIIEIIRTRPI